MIPANLTAFLVVGCPGSGKSWVCGQLAGLYHYVPHDQFKAAPGASYTAEICRQSHTAKRPLLIETPFSMSQIVAPLEHVGFHVTPVFIQEHPEVIRQRYWAREGRELPAGHLTRQRTYQERATAMGHFQGTSSQVLEYLRALAS
ncbi:ATP-binding protein [Bradyrhizobium septentrionale]|uniref:Uncharacterized protein n=1 Tax=Bradyrhizobium septentrionale TaxID=1404411 RepID=A0A974A3L7_9BRAD|nr:hypothetical protein [Bradyrhizobium septentrionale]UGY15143.1 ATP-binding protein [Bradyrhizobium septentrionale]UGY23749.1 ATP-binding protein [Bradyrhizobium septentrionale]